MPDVARGILKKNLKSRFLKEKKEFFSLCYPSGSGIGFFIKRQPIRSSRFPATADIYERREYRINQDKNRRR